MLDRLSLRLRQSRRHLPHQREALGVRIKFEKDTSSVICFANAASPSRGRLERCD